jgi:hypothetical protein
MLVQVGQVFLLVRALLLLEKSYISNSVHPAMGIKDKADPLIVLWVAAL